MQRRFCQVNHWSGYSQCIGLELELTFHSRHAVRPRSTSVRRGLRLGKCKILPLLSSIEEEIPPRGNCRQDGRQSSVHCWDKSCHHSGFARMLGSRWKCAEDVDIICRHLRRKAFSASRLTICMQNLSSPAGSATTSLAGKKQLLSVRTPVVVNGSPLLQTP